MTLTKEEYVTYHLKMLAKEKLTDEQQRKMLEFNYDVAVADIKNAKAINDNTTELSQASSNLLANTEQNKLLLANGSSLLDNYKKQIELQKTYQEEKQNAVVVDGKSYPADMATFFVLLAIFIWLVGTKVWDMLWGVGENL